MATFTVDTSADADGVNFHTIQDAINASVPGTVIVVADGTYNENLTIAVSGITLLSENGRGAVTINGSAGTLGTIVVADGVTGVTIGDTGQGFIINGFDGPTPGIETAAVYLQGNMSDITIRDNEIVAKGDAGLQTEYGRTVTNIVVDGNTFSGQTFTGTPGIGDQFTVDNVPRQLVVIGDNGPSLTTNITFTNNEITGTAGGITSGGLVSGNTLVTIDAANSIITGNDFSGFTNRFATQLRVREEGTIISNNIYSSEAGGNLGLFTQFGSGETAGPMVNNSYDYGDGDDVIVAVAGDDAVDGGAGIDTYVMSNAGAAGSLVDLNAGLSFSTATGIDSLSNIENVSGSAGADGLYGNEASNVFFATAGADVIDGRGGSDTFSAAQATGNITANLTTGSVSGAHVAALTSVENIVTGSGSDSITLSSANNSVDAGAGSDTIIINSTDGAGTDSIDGGEGTDVVSFNEARDAYTVAWDGATATVTHTASGDVTTITDVGQLAFSDSDVFLVDDSSTEFSTIQSAVDAASSGDEILVSAGTYTEQVTVDGKDDLTITGLGGVTVMAPADVVETALSSSGRETHAVITVLNGENVTIAGMTVDGDGRGTTVDEGMGAGQAQYVGVFFRNASGGLENVDITGVRDPYAGGTTVDGYPIVSGVQRGVGLQVDNDTMLAFFMHGGSISDFQKNATVFSRADLDVDGVTITGGGAQTIIAQNGIQVLNSTGTIANNIVTAIGYTGSSVAYSGMILAYGNADLNIVGNTLTGTNGVTAASMVGGIFILDFGTANSGGSITGNIISKVDFGIDVSGNVTPGGITISANTVTDLDLSDLYAAGVSFMPNPVLTTPYSVEGTQANDFLSGGAGNDSLSGLGGNDEIIGGAGTDTLNAGDGDDKIVYGDESELTATESVDGGAGNDTILYGDANGGTLTLTANVMRVETVEISNASALNNVVMNIDASAIGNGATITGNAAANTLTGTAFADAIHGYDGHDALNGGAGDDALSGGGGNDTLQGGANNDTLIGGAGADILNGGSGIDTVSYETSSAGVSINLILGTASGGDAAGDTLALIENLTGSAQSDSLTGDNIGNTLDGGAGNDALVGMGGADALFGGDGDDTLNGGVGVDEMTGGAGNDLYYVDVASDKVFEVAGGGTADRVLAKVSFTLAASAEIETLGTFSQAGTNAINLTGNDFAQTIIGNAGVNVLSGLGGDDWLRGLAGSDTLLGGEGNDTLDGGIGDDSMTGGAGNDLYLVDAANDVVVETAGGGTEDKVQANVSYVLAAGADIEILTTLLQAGSAAINLTGNNLAQTITGNAGANVLSGLGGNDLLEGLAGNDTLLGGNGIDTLDGGTGADEMTGGAGNDTYLVDNAADMVIETAGGGGLDRVLAKTSYVLTAGSEVEALGTTFTGGLADINLTGNEMAQRVTGNAGANVLNGLGGNDILTGNAGADSFVFSSTLGAGNVDTITDFSVNDDTILMAASVFSDLAIGVLSADAFAANATGDASDALQRIIYETNTGNVWFDADGLGGVDRVLFATLTPELALTNADFLVF
ncbi:MAG: hypothetical protein U1A24_09905 [Cypionkella sp.]|uniref:beta strand repeat-containing protein n=1 Tax=Cypionkella sp. TaxID=2811411 RepID=UPI002AB97671|nr:hypothetical protein [Cypionkella sp.]MDZ4310850.1 hypothetical protein [Cypionkella sp.]